MSLKPLSTSLLTPIYISQSYLCHFYLNRCNVWQKAPSCLSAILTCTVTGKLAFVGCIQRRFGATACPRGKEKLSPLSQVTRCQWVCSDLCHLKQRHRSKQPRTAMGCPGIVLDLAQVPGDPVSCSSPPTAHFPLHWHASSPLQLQDDSGLHPISKGF